MADIFISYKSERRAAVEHLTRVIENNGYSVWFDYAMLSGGGFTRQIEREIRAARAVLVLWCPLSVNSDWVLEEATLAKKLDSLIPIIAATVNPPFGFQLADAVDLTEWNGAPRSGELDRLLDQISIKVGRDPSPNFRALSQQEKTWRNFGALSFSQFPLDETAGIAERKRSDAKEDDRIAREQQEQADRAAAARAAQERADKAAAEAVARAEADRIAKAKQEEDARRAKIMNEQEAKRLEEQKRADQRAAAARNAKPQSEAAVRANKSTAVQANWLKQWPGWLLLGAGVLLVGITVVSSQRPEDGPKDATVAPAADAMAPAADAMASPANTPSADTMASSTTPPSQKVRLAWIEGVWRVADGKLGCDIRISLSADGEDVSFTQIGSGRQIENSIELDSMQPLDEFQTKFSRYENLADGEVRVTDLDSKKTSRLQRCLSVKR